MATQRITKQLPGETFLATEPTLLQQVDPGWRRRLSLYTGRALTDVALAAEQQYRSGRLAVLSQLVSPGIGNGLDATVDKAGSIHVSAGYGFTATGEDVTLPRELVVGFDALPVIDAITAAPIKSFADLKKDPTVKGGVFVMMLQPVTGKVTGQAINTGENFVEVSGDIADSCTRDPELYAFEDWELVDGSRLVLARWPDQPDALKLPDSNPAGTWRNRIVYTIFNAELALNPDDDLPWEGIGVALALVAFDAAWKMQFLDRNAVARSGGRARKLQLRNPTVTQLADFQLAPRAAVEARLLQLLEQNAQIANQTDLTAFANLPPTGILPVAALDLVKKANRWFPPKWKLHVAPIHSEEVETALRSQIFASPLDLTQATDEVDVLLPLSDDAFDPNVLVDEKLAQIFLDELKKATDARDAVLQHRRFLQQEANALLQAVAEQQLDLDAGLNDSEVKASKAAPYQPPADGSEAYGTSVVGGKTVSSDVNNLKQTAGAAPYTVKVGDKTIPLISPADWTYLDQNGLPAFIDRINARLDKVDDLLNLHFLQTQTNIYRYRTNVLNASAASRLVTSPIIANIAQRESAVATAQDLAAYIGSIGPKPGTPPPAAQPTPPPSPPTNLRTVGGVNVLRTVVPATRLSSTVLSAAKEIGTVVGTTVKPAAVTPVITAVFSTKVADITKAVETLPSTTELPTQDDVTSQLPLSGVPFNLRTLSVAERLQTSPSHEALLYSASSRLTLLDQLLADDLGITVDDLEVLVQEQDAHDATKFNLVPYSLSKLRDGATRTAVYGNVQKAGLPNNSDESAVFSAGITALDHHTLLLRAVEARISVYRQFMALASKALAAIRGSVNDVMAALNKIGNDLGDARHNLVFVNAIISDENQRIDAVNKRRAQVLANVPFVVYMRRATIAAEADVPSRQLMPANVASPVPTALASNAIIPPELRELAGLLREAPPAWIPATEELLSALERPQHFLEIATHMQLRAYTKLQVPLLQSSATSHPGPYGPPIADVFTSQQTSLTQLVQQRAAYDPAPLMAMTWAEQKGEIFRVSAINDLISSEIVHLEVANRVTALINDVSKVATALYLRVSAVLPVNRLQWAEFLRGPGRWISLRTLSVLPAWDTQDYIDRQQMQMLVDWLFGQIDAGIDAANSYMSDLVRTAILLASHAPVNDVIAGEVAARTKPSLGGIVPLGLPSSRVARGMPVLLYQGGELTARAVVDDLDSQQVYAKVTTIYQANTYLEEKAQAQFLNDDPQSAVLTKASLALR